MKTRIFFIFIYLLVFLTPIFFIKNAVSQLASDKQDTLISQEAFEEWKNTFKKEAIQKGVSEKILDEVLPALKPLQHVIASDQKQNEFLLTFWDYTDRTISETRIKKGQEMLKEHGALLSEVSEKYGVQPRYIIAFWGLETNYGTYKGSIKTTDALATLAFDKRRRKFFTNELITLLKIMQEGEKTDFYGSWAGAFGNFQFMPTTYAAYAVDADNDGKKDIINSLPDAFSSAANYLSKMGWDKDLKWGREVILPQKLDWDKVHSGSQKTIDEWAKMGIKPADKSHWNKNDLDKKAKLTLPMGTQGPAFLTYRNYDLIMRWNNSTLYALSVGILSEKITNSQFTVKHKRTTSRFSRDDIKSIQEGLSQKGYYTGGIDGILGKGSKKAIRLYQKEVQMEQDGYPSRELLQKLKTEYTK